MKKFKKISRRSFIKNSIVGVSGVFASDSIFAGIKGINTKNNAIIKTRVVHVHNDKVIDSEGRINQQLLQQMIDNGIRELSSQNNLVDAWSRYYKDTDVIGMKLNLNAFRALKGTEFLNCYPIVTNEILKSMLRGGISEKQAIIWERSDEELSEMGYTISKSKNSLRVMGTTEKRRAKGAGYTDKVYKVGDSTSHISRILTDHCTAILNIPILKSHNNAGVSGSLKNHFGTIDNPGDYHSAGCVNPGVPEVNALPEIKEKNRLIIGIGLMGLFDGGPWWRREIMWTPGSLVFGTDPVAVDTFMLKMLDSKRLKMGLSPAAPRAKHLQISESLGLGTCTPANIEFKEITV